MGFLSSLLPDSASVKADKKMAAEAAAEAARKRAEASEAAERAKAKAFLDSRGFKKGGRVTGFKGYGAAKKV